MNRLAKYIITLFILLPPSITTESQTKEIEIETLKAGSKMPAFELDDVEYDKKQHIFSKDSKGKWLILDFWNEYCSACIKGFRNMNALQWRHKSDIDIILIGYTGSQYNPLRSSNSSIRKLYAKCMMRDGLNIAAAFDSILFHRFNIEGCPFIVIINPEGTIEAITYEISDDQIGSLLRGEKVKFLKNGEVENETDKERPKIDANFGDASKNEFIFRSELVPWVFGSEINSPNQISDTANIFRLAKCRLGDLYLYSLIGKRWWGLTDSNYGNVALSPILEVADSLEFNLMNKIDGKYWNYCVRVPQSVCSRRKIMSCMQNDLKNYFEYSAKLERRLEPYWRLVLLNRNSQQFVSHETQTDISIIPNMGFDAKSIAVSRLIEIIWASNQSEPPIIDETGITSKIDIKLSCLMTDMSEIKRSLNKSGFDLVLGQKEMSVVVISDKIQE